YAVTAGTEVGFTGFMTAAVVRINELELNGAGGCDLIELRAIEGGSMEGFVLGDRNASPVLTFPTGFTVAKNELIVVHIAKNNSNCNGGEAPEDEVAGPNTVEHANNFPGAYDFWSTNSGIATNGGNAIHLKDATSSCVDFVLHMIDTVTPNANALNTAQAAGEAGAWPLAEGGCTAGNVRDHALLYTTASGDGSLQRTDDADSNDWSGWAQQLPANIGELNPGQSPIP